MTKQKNIVFDLKITIKKLINKYIQKINKMAKRKEASYANKKRKTKGEISSFRSETESEKGKKTYILDTNVILNDPYCLKHFGEHNICIPIMVLEELDKFKKGNEPNNVNTREFHRIFNRFGDELFNGGISLGENRGKLTVALGVDYPPEMKKSFSTDTQDHRILAIALDKKRKGENVVLVTNDINLQIKARALGVKSESYRHDSVKDLESIQASVISYRPRGEGWEELTKDMWNTNGYRVPKSLKKYPENSLFNIRSGKGEKGEEYLVRKCGKYLMLVGYYNGKESVSGIEAKNNEQRFCFDALLDDNIRLVAITGNAGTGKTLISLAAALDQKDTYEEILVARPAIEMSNKTLGFLPGKLDGKIDPYMKPIFDNLAIIKEASEKKKGKKGTSQSVEDWAKEQKISTLVLNFVRGRSLANRFIIIDEAQNLTPHEIKTIITRAAKGTKIVLVGDISQVDSPYQNERSNGLSYLIDRFRGQSEFAHIHLNNGERSPLAALAGQLL